MQNDHQENQKKHLLVQMWENNFKAPHKANGVLTQWVHNNKNISIAFSHRIV
jgi:hypothetical protein